MSTPANDSSIDAGSGYSIMENAPMLARNTLHVAAKAELLIEVHDDAALDALFQLPRLKDGPLLVLGGGSNLLLAGDVEGVVVAMQTRGIECIVDADDHAILRVAAGENWDEFVHYTLAQGYAGMENLVSIPGTVGAVPIQNIGAYGTEAEEFITMVEAFDRTNGERVRLDRKACTFGYRDSVFKHELDRYVITAVEFRLPRHRPVQLDYAGVHEELADLGYNDPQPVQVAQAIARIRARKLPDPQRVGNAGSFFKNPIVDSATASRLRSTFPTLPQWPAGDDMYKASAAALIELAGLKGYREGAAGVSDQHALVLVNHGGASGAALLAMARHVVATVNEKFGVILEPEPRIISATL
ncbi:MAG: UDP-N-acetylmuramate dehydrogenase [Dokdonella sp.]